MPGPAFVLPRVLNLYPSGKRGALMIQCMGYAVALFGVWAPCHMYYVEQVYTTSCVFNSIVVESPVGSFHAT